MSDDGRAEAGSGMDRESAATPLGQPQAPVPSRDATCGQLRHQWGTSEWCQCGDLHWSVLQGWTGPVAPSRPVLVVPHSDTQLFDWMEREGFGCWHDASTNKWVSMAGARFDTPRAAIRAAIAQRGADTRDVRR